MDAFKDAIFWCIDAMYGFVADWGLAIIIVTLILRLILFPLMQKQIRSSYRMQQFSPRIQEIQEKYADDQQRQAEEMQKVYAEIGFNPITGCLPLFLQMLSSLPVPGIAGNGLPYRRHDLLLL